MLFFVFVFVSAAANFVSSQAGIYFPPTHHFDYFVGMSAKPFTNRWYRVKLPSFTVQISRALSVLRVDSVFNCHMHSQGQTIFFTFCHILRQYCIFISTILVLPFLVAELPVKMMCSLSFWYMKLFRKLIHFIVVAGGHTKHIFLDSLHLLLSRLAH